VEFVAAFIYFIGHEFHEFHENDHRHLNAIGLKYDLSQSLPAALRDAHFQVTLGFEGDGKRP